MKQIDVITPFDFCKNCNNCKLQEIQIFADGKYMPRYECDLLFCDDCNRKRKEIEMKKIQLERAQDIDRRLRTIDCILKSYNSSGSAIIGISVVTDDLGMINQIPDFNVLLTKKFQDEALKLLKEYKKSLEEEFENF